jgi:hypothetical protein
MFRVCNCNEAGRMKRCVCRRDAAGRKSRIALRCMELLTAWGKRRLSPAYVPSIDAKREGGGSDARSSGRVWRQMEGYRRDFFWEPVPKVKSACLP